MNKQRGPLEAIGGDWFINRKEELDLFWQWATSVPERVHGSYALIGLRRTGKTAILHRLFNRLFHEQEKVIPVYYNPDTKRVRDMTDSFQEAAETHWAPPLVSGSAVSMMVDNALGSGLAGRFSPWRLAPLAQEFAYTMIFRLGERNKITITEESDLVQFNQLAERFGFLPLKDDKKIG
jgi:hypothetical protein